MSLAEFLQILVLALVFAYYRRPAKHRPEQTATPQAR